MHYIPNLPQDEVLILRQAANTIRAVIYEIERTRFCPKLESYARELSALTDCLDDTCVEGLMTDDEYNEGLRLNEEERQHRLDIRSLYNAGLL